MNKIYLIVPAALMSANALADSRFVTFSSSVRIARIHASQAMDKGDGESRIRLKYYLRCNEKFAGLVSQQVGPLAASHGEVAAAVLLQDTGIKCAAADTEETHEFDLPNIVGGTTVNLVSGQ